MVNIFTKLFGSFTSGGRKTYEEQRDALRSANVQERLEMAKSTWTNKEILYYLAEKDPEPSVRKAVLQNKSLPVQASTVLAKDVDQDVRLMLAGRLVDLLPEASKNEQSQMYAFVVQALGTLALDEVLKIRVALSSTLKDHAHTPPKIAGQLARDVEQQVSEPILRFCAALSDNDLMDILKSHPASWVIESIAGREKVSHKVSQAVIDTRDKYGGRELISNIGADINEDLLHHIVEIARTMPEWQKPMAVRKALPSSVARELAEFVDASVRELLLKRGDFNEAETEEIAAVFRRRVDFAEIQDQGTAEERLQQLIKDKALNEEVISDALAMRDREFAALAVAYLAKTSSQEVMKIFDMKAAKPIIALSWLAGLSMRMALQLQKDAAHVPPRDIIYPKGGTDYPLSEDAMLWQLEFLGLKKAKKA